MKLFMIGAENLEAEVVEDEDLGFCESAHEIEVGSISPCLRDLVKHS